MDTVAADAAALRQAVALLTKSAGDAELSHGLKGRLYLAKSGWILLSVPNALGRGAFEALNEPGAELPVNGATGQYNAHISVMRPEEIAQIGGADKVVERGKEFGFTLGPVRTVVPAGWAEMSKCWFIEVNSPELERLRKSYGLSGLPNNGQYKFHITFAVRRKNVLRENPVAVSRGSIHRLAETVQKAAGDSSFYLNAARNHLDNLATGGRTVWQPGQGLFGNLANHVNAIRRRGAADINAAEQWRRLQFAAQRMNYHNLLRDVEAQLRQGAAWGNQGARDYHQVVRRVLQQHLRNLDADLATNDFLHYLQTGRNPVVNHPVDMLMQGQMPLGSLLLGTPKGGG